MIIYLLLIVIYTTIPPITLFFCLKWIYKDKWKYGWHLNYFFKHLFTLSFIPLLFVSNLELGIIPRGPLSVVLLLSTVAFALLGIKPALKEKVLFFYFSGVYAAFMEEILYRGIIFALAFALWQNQWVALAVSSFLFGTWHLKNYHWCGKKNSIIQFFYTALGYGPIFALMRIFTGDIWLAVLFHFITDATCALAPNWMRDWLVRGGRGGNYMDDYARNKK